MSDDRKVVVTPFLEIKHPEHSLPMRLSLKQARDVVGQIQRIVKDPDAESLEDDDGER